jgi:hypothetical protein
MYGMVNMAVEEFLTDRYGSTVWQAVKDRAAPEVDHFLTMEQYPDELTDRLMGAAVEVTGATPDQISEAFGDYFVGYAKRSGHGELLDIIGSSLPEALDNLDNMHTRVALAFPDLRPPSFWCTEVTDHSLILHYLSERRGMTATIPGAVRGLARLFDTEVNVRLVASRDEGADHDQFLVTYQARR